MMMSMMVRMGRFRIRATCAYERKTQTNRHHEHIHEPEPERMFRSEFRNRFC